MALGVVLTCSVGAYAQFSVEGTVEGPNGEPLIGVSILVQGTTTGTISDLDGSFNLTVPGERGTLVFSYTGFQAQEVPVDESTGNLDVIMVEDIARLDEVVVTGLASGVRRSNSGNAVATISGAELTDRTTPQTLDGALSGRLAGVNISTNSGAPGGGINVQLRGISTLGAGSSQPLYIVDGVYIDNSSIRTGRSQVSGATGGASSATQDGAANRIADLNPEDIERIEVLKGPSAAAIYGTRANAGVVIITTKRGEAGQTRISLTQDIGFAQGQNFVGFDDWDEAKIDAYYGGDPDELAALREAQAEGRVTDWEEYLYGETPLLSNTQLSVSGGSTSTQFYVAGGWTSEDGIIENTGFDRYSVRANLDHRINDRVKVSLSSNYLKSDSDRGFTGNQNNTGGSLGYSIAYTPTYADLFPDAQGNYPNNPYFNDNPIAIRDLGINNQEVDRFLMAATMDFDLMQSATSYLKFRLNGGIDYLSGNSLVYFPEILQHQQANANPGDVMWGRQDNLNSNIQGFLIFGTNLSADLSSTTTAGAVRLDSESQFLLQRGRGLSGGQRNLQWAQVTNVQEQTFQEVTDLGLVVQEDLNWRDQIIVSAGIRFDKSTLNAQQNEFYAFPKFSIAGNLHNFDFWSIESISQLKLRAAYGETGGLPRFGVIYEALSSQLIGGQLGGQVGTRGVDPDLVPETAQEIEVGLDLGLFDNAVTLEATYYDKQVENLILDRQPAESTGILAIATNAADLQNKGFELGLTINPVRSTTFNWLSRILYWQNDSEITRLNVPAFTTGGFGSSLGTYLIQEGFSPTTIVGNPSNSDERPETLGLTVYGDRQADFQMSWFNTINFLDNFDFSMLLHYQNGGSAINLSALLWDDGGTTPNWDGDDDNDGTPNGLDRLLTWAGGNTGVYIEPTDYIKLREVSLYYTFPSSVFGTALDRVKVGVSANNLLLWTDYSSYDPEVSNFGTQPISGNIEVTPYPSARRVFFHLKADF